MNRRSITALAAGGSIMLATVVIALICVKSWEGIIPVAFAFLLWSEFVLCGGFVLIEYVAVYMHQPLFRAAWGAAIFLYSCAAFIVSVMFMLTSKRGIKGFLTIQEILFACLAVALAVFYAVCSGAMERSGKVMDCCERIEEMVDRLNILKAMANDKHTAVRIDELAENLRFTDVSVTVPVDEEISRMISFLETLVNADVKQKSEDEMEGLFKKLDSLIIQRKIDAAASKRGKI